jgi:hypothetical protein
LDLRDNKLTDPTELARLTGIPELKEIWVSGNPFVKTHSNYRITIFNLFRKTPGFTEDIIIDASGPGYNERRQLAERVPERENVPVVKPPPSLLPAVDITKPAIIYDAPRDPAVLRKERPHPSTTTSEIYTSASRRRRTPKRRIVDLSTSDSSSIKQTPAPISSAEDATSAAAGSDSGYGVSPETKPSEAISSSTSPPPLRRPSSSQAEALPRLDTSTTPHLRAADPGLDASTLALETQDWSVSGEMYRRKIEALRNEVGNGWLSVLSEEGWDAQKLPLQHASAEFSPASTVRPSPTTTMQRPKSQQTIHGGRTLG